MDANVSPTFAASLKAMMTAWDKLQDLVIQEFPEASAEDIYQMTSALFKAAVPQWAALANTKLPRGKS